MDVKNHVGEEVTIGAWVANKSGKGKIAFLQLRDGTAFFQAVAFKPNFLEKFGEEAGLEKFNTIKHISQYHQTLEPRNSCFSKRNRQRR